MAVAQTAQERPPTLRNDAQGLVNRIIAAANNLETYANQIFGTPPSPLKDMTSPTAPIEATLINAVINGHEGMDRLEQLLTRFETSL